MVARTVVDRDDHRTLSIVSDPGWELCDVEGAIGVLGLLRPRHDPGAFRTNLIICRDRVPAATGLGDLMAASARHMAAKYLDFELRGSEDINLGDAPASVALRVFDAGPGARRVNQLQVVIDAGVDPGAGPDEPRVIYQLIATVAAEHSEAYADDIIELVGGAAVEFAPTSGADHPETPIAPG